jgi:hypothetical protein
MNRGKVEIETGHGQNHFQNQEQGRGARNAKRGRGKIEAGTNISLIKRGWNMGTDTDKDKSR